MFYRYICFVVLFFSSRLDALVTVLKQPQLGQTHSIELTTLYGATVITEPVLIALIEHPAFERLQDMHQYGAYRYLPGEAKFTRYEHSLGVFFLTRKFGAPLSEQIAALLHDVSHTAFSHVGDVLFKSNYCTGKDAYQDTIHEWYLQQVGITPLLEAHGFAEVCTVAAKQGQRCFDQPLPHICADRLEYNLSGGFLDGLISREGIVQLLDQLRFEDGQWYFVELDAARTFGLISLSLSEHRWGSLRGVYVDYVAALALKRACDRGIITIADIHFSADTPVWNKLQMAADPIITRCTELIERYGQQDPAPQGADVLVVSRKGKFSGVDPLVRCDNGLVALSILDADYRAEFERVRGVIAAQWKFELPAIFEQVALENAPRV